jgi:hypothetical protein
MEKQVLIGTWGRHQLRGWGFKHPDATAVGLKTIASAQLAQEVVGGMGIAEEHGPAAAEALIGHLLEA